MKLLIPKPFFIEFGLGHVYFDRGMASRTERARDQLKFPVGMEAGSEALSEFLSPV
jgi:hypothetical protein